MQRIDLPVWDIPNGIELTREFITVGQNGFRSANYNQGICSTTRINLISAPFTTSLFTQAME